MDEYSIPALHFPKVWLYLTGYFYRMIRNHKPNFHLTWIISNISIKLYGFFYCSPGFN